MHVKSKKDISIRGEELFLPTSPEELDEKKDNKDDEEEDEEV